MKYKLLQLKNTKDCEYAFRSYSSALRHNLKLSDYDVIYEGELTSYFKDDESALDLLFRNFNRVTIEDIDRLNKIGFTGRSLSTSDIVVLDNKFYYCDSFGWARI